MMDAIAIGLCAYLAMAWVWKNRFDAAVDELSTGNGALHLIFGGVLRFFMLVLAYFLLRVLMFGVTHGAGG